MANDFKVYLRATGELIAKFAMFTLIATGITLIIGHPIINQHEKQIKKEVKKYQDVGHTGQEVAVYEQILKQNFLDNLGHDR